MAARERAGSDYRDYQADMKDYHNRMSGLVAEALPGEIKAGKARLKRAITKAKGLKTQKEKELRSIKKISSKKVPR